MKEDGIGIVFITKDHLELFSPYTTAVIEFVYPQRAVKDFDLISKNEFSLALNAFLQSLNLPVSSYIFLLSENIVYDHVFDTSDGKALDEDTFVDIVPFEKVISARIPSENSLRILSTNGEMIELLKTMFDAQQYSVQLIISETLLGVQLTHLDPSTAMAIVKTALDFRVFGFLVQHQTFPKNSSQINQTKIVSQRNLVGVLVLILLIVGLVISVYVYAF